MIDEQGTINNRWEELILIDEQENNQFPTSCLCSDVTFGALQNYKKSQVESYENFE